MAETEQLVKLLRNCSRILVFSGAGISTETGIPDYRGPNGVWKTRAPVYYEEFLARETKRVEYWQYKLEWWDAFRDVKPTATHRAIKRLDDAGRVVAVVTQNVDGLHRRAGHDPAKIVELHGTNLEADCQTCGFREPIARPMDEFRMSRRCPRCPKCGGLLKPATISFGQPLRENDLNRAYAAAQSADLVMALGSTLSVYPAAFIPLYAVERGAKYVIINCGDTAHDHHAGVTLRIHGKLDDVVPAALDRALAACANSASSGRVTSRE